MTEEGRLGIHEEVPGSGVRSGARCGHKRRHRATLFGKRDEAKKSSPGDRIGPARTETESLSDSTPQ